MNSAFACADWLVWKWLFTSEQLKRQNRASIVRSVSRPFFGKSRGKNLIFFVFERCTLKYLPTSVEVNNAEIYLAPPRLGQYSPPRGWITVKNRSGKRARWLKLSRMEFFIRENVKRRIKRILLLYVRKTGPLRLVSSLKSCSHS